MNVAPLHPAAIPTLPIVDLSAWIDREPDPREFLVDDLIPNGCVTALYGDGGSGKTMLAMWLMVAMASRYSLPWLGRKAKGWKSVGLFAEDDGDEIVRRIHRICKGMGVDYSTVAPNIMPVAGVGMDTVLAGYDNGFLVRTALMHALVAKVNEVGANLLVLDYAAAIFGGNEMDRAQVNEFMRLLNAVAKENDIAILLLGHPSMEGMKGGRGTSGSTSWRNQSRSFLHLTVDEDQNDPDGRRLLTLAHTKSNYSRWGTEFSIASDGGAFEVLEERDGSSVKAEKAPSGPRLTAAQKVCLKALEMALDHHGENQKVTPAHIDKRCVRVEVWRQQAYSMGVSSSDDEASRRRAFYDTRKALQAKGIIGEADPWAWLA